MDCGLYFYICFKTEGCGLGKFPKKIIKPDLINFIKYMCGKVHCKQIKLSVLFVACILLFLDMVRETY